MGLHLPRVQDLSLIKTQGLLLAAAVHPGGLLAGIQHADIHLSLHLWALPMPFSGIHLRRLLEGMQEPLHVFSAVPLVIL